MTPGERLHALEGARSPSKDPEERARWVAKVLGLKDPDAVEVLEAAMAAAGERQASLSAREACEQCAYAGGF